MTSSGKSFVASSIKSVRVAKKALPGLVSIGAAAIVAFAWDLCLDGLKEFIKLYFEGTGMRTTVTVTILTLIKILTLKDEWIHLFKSDESDRAQKIYQEETRHSYVASEHASFNASSSRTFGRQESANEGYEDDNADKEPASATSRCDSSSGLAVPVANTIQDSGIPSMPSPAEAGVIECWYHTRRGKKFHINPNCPGLSRAKDLICVTCKPSNLDSCLRCCKE